MQFHFVDTNPAVCRKIAEMIPYATVHNCKLWQVPETSYDILFTPGNSYGLMDGGFDQAVRDLYPGSEAQVQSSIRTFHHGLLPIGTSLDISLKHSIAETWIWTKRLMYAPTMRVPQAIDGTDNVYWAFRAALVESLRWRNYFGDRRLQILSPCFGTSAGKVPIEKAVGQIALAIEHVARKVPETAPTWRDVWGDHKALEAVI